MRLAAILGLTILITFSANAAPGIGSEAPDFSAVDSNGEVVQLSQLRGEVVVLEWTNHDCPYVKKHYGTGNMQALQKRARDLDVVWLSVISSASGKQGYVQGNEANRLTEERGAHPTSVLLDPEGTIGRLYQATNTPHMFVINTQGILVYAGGIDDQPSARWSSIEGARNYVEEALDSVVAGRTVEVSAARVYGCSVKY